MQINDKIDMLTIIRRVPNDKYRNIRFECRCDCGKLVIRSKRTLSTNRFHSCGCTRVLTDEILRHCSDAGRARANKRNVDGINTDMLFRENNISTNTSGQKGISWSKSANKWHVYIGYKNYRCNLGYYVDMKDAIKIRDQALAAVKNNNFEEFFYQLRGFKIEEKLHKIYK